MFQSIPAFQWDPARAEAFRAASRSMQTASSPSKGEERSIEMKRWSLQQRQVESRCCCVPRRVLVSGRSPEKELGGPNE